jgi:acetylornithine deacetylase/succinyl-diaminopimelate desuccinylase-like protein
MSSAAYDPAGEVVGICRDLIRIDTSNHGDQDGPGERAAAEHVATLLDDVGIEARLLESERGRASVVARWGGGSGEPLLLHGHLDVVPAEPADWTRHPFSGEVADGCVWGRGAVDMKDFDAMLLSLVRARARAGVVPRRPIALVFTADEETGGGLGAGWLVDRHRDLIEDCTIAIGEVGGFSTTVRDRRVYLLHAAEKGMAWLRLTARGPAGHGSMLQPGNAVARLSTAVARLSAHDWPVRLTPAMRVLIAAVAEIAGTEATPENAETLIEEFGPAARMLGASLRHTLNPTMLQAGYKLNVVPGEAVAYVDGRVVPGYEEEFYTTVARLVGDGVEAEWVTDLPGVQADVDGAVVDAMNAALLAHDPDGVVAPYMTSGGTDGKHWSRLGMRCYGYSPLRLPAGFDFTGLFHGVDERVPVDSLTFGARVLDELLDRL